MVILKMKVDNMWERIEKSRSNGFGLEVKRRIMPRNVFFIFGLYDEYYGKAEQARQIIKSELNDIFTKVDILVTSNFSVYCI